MVRAPVLCGISLERIKSIASGVSSVGRARSFQVRGHRFETDTPLGILFVPKNIDMIIDCFTFFNEYDILEGRLEYLYDTVDRFVIVEANITHSGKAKPFNYLENQDRYRKWADKIVYSTVEIDAGRYNWNIRSTRTESYSPQWAVENLQRNHIARALEAFSPDDIVMISDADEIPNTQMIPEVIRHLSKDMPAIAMIQDMFYYNLDNKQVNPWVGTVITTNQLVQQRRPQWFRTKRNTLPGAANGGWHLSYWGSIDVIRTKIESFAHQEHNTDEIKSQIADRMSRGEDLFGRSDNLFIPADRHTLPRDFLAIFDTNPSQGIPHYYETVEGFFRPEDVAFYKKVINYFSGPAHFVEIGSYKGRSSSFMAVEIARSGKAIQFDCVDTWEGSEEHQAGKEFEDPDVVNRQMFDVFLNNMSPVKGYYNPVRMTSLEAADQYDDASLDFVFIDAAHDYDSVRADILAWEPKVKIGGIISGHDYLHPPLKQAVDEIFGELPSIGACWYKIK